MAMVLYGGLQIIFSLSVDAALIRNNDATKEDFNTAWTIGIIQSVIISAILFFSSPQTASFFGDERLENIIQVICISVIIRSLGNIGTVYFRKDLEFHKEVTFELLTKLFSIVATILLAYYIRTYWALVYGMIASAIIRIILSYTMHNYRPKITLCKFKSLWSFSSWMILLNGGMFLAQQGDRYIVGSQLPAEDMGLYTTSAELAELPTTELLFPLTTTLFPGFAKIQHEPDRLKAAFIQVIGFISGTVLAAGLGLCLISNEFILLILGKSWADAIPLLQTLALFGICRAIYILPRNLLIILKKEKLVAAMAWANAISFLSIAYVTLTQYNLMAMMLAKITLAIIYAFISLYIVMRVIKINRHEVSSNLVRPLIAGFLMILTVNFIFDHISLGLTLSLIIKIIIGATTYLSVLLGLWVVMGNPKGFESFSLYLIGSSLKKVKQFFKTN